NHGRANGAGRCRGNLLRCHQRLETRVVPLALPLFGDNKDLHGQITRASNFSFSTSLAAISLGVPVRNSVFLVFVGTYILSIFCVGSIVTPSDSRVRTAISFFFAVMMPFSVA